jgi:hypothetical protein
MHVFAFCCAVFLATASAAEQPTPGIEMVRPVVGVGPVLSDGGLGFAAQVGIRLDRLLLRLTVELGGGVAPRQFSSGQFRADWFVYGHWFAGTGVAQTTYGFLFDDPVASATMLTPGVGYVLGADKLLGRVIFQVTGQVPLGHAARPSDDFGQQIAPPTVVASVILSL